MTEMCTFRSFTFKDMKGRILKSFYFIHIEKALMWFFNYFESKQLLYLFYFRDTHLDPVSLVLPLCFTFLLHHHPNGLQPVTVWKIEFSHTNCHFEIWPITFTFLRVIVFRYHSLCFRKTHLDLVFDILLGFNF